MKRVFLIGGTMGVGKTSVCRCLKGMLARSVFLDGDWCWDASAAEVADETKAMVLDNICHLLNNYICCSAYDNIIFGWVMHEQSIMDDILGRLDLRACDVAAFSLVCTREALEARLAQDIAAGTRRPDIVVRSVARLPLYDGLNTTKIDVSAVTVRQASEMIARHAGVLAAI